MNDLQLVPPGHDISVNSVLFSSGKEQNMDRRIMDTLDSVTLSTLKGIILVLR